MGGTTTSVKRYYPTYNNINDYIKKECFISSNFHEIINKSNYIDKLKKYNLSELDLKKIEASFHCISRKIKCVRQYYFNEVDSGIFNMIRYDFNIITNNKNEKEVTIIKNFLQYNINNPYLITENQKRGWGIFFFYHSSTQTKTKRALNSVEIENVKQLMKKRLGIKLLNNK